MEKIMNAVSILTGIGILAFIVILANCNFEFTLLLKLLACFDVCGVGLLFMWVFDPARR